MSIVYLNGQLLPKEDAKISPQDRGFLFGDGVYEAIPFYRGKPFAMDLHWKRVRLFVGNLSLSFILRRTALFGSITLLPVLNVLDRQCDLTSLYFCHWSIIEIHLIVLLIIPAALFKVAQWS